MSERKVLNKYYPPDFDPAKIPKLKLPKDRQYVVRLMAPFNMRCKTCGEYIYKGKKFNARKETVQSEQYLGLPIFRFYIKCTRCLAEITFKTDPENTDYTMEHGATRNFQAEKLIEEEEKRVLKEREEEELNNPMKVLENRTKDSKLEMEVLENLQELKELNQRQANVDFEAILKQHKDYEEELKHREEEEDDREMRAMMEQAQQRRLIEDSDSDEETSQQTPKPAVRINPTDILSERSEPPLKKQKTESWEKSVGKLSATSRLAGLVVVKRKQNGKPSTGNSRTEETQKSNREVSQGAKGQSSVGTGSAISSFSNAQRPVALKGSSLSLLGAYSDSEESNSD
ncbi:splicing factor YJU2 [Latimeria chalumnae]|uniref:Splicing factor YJU2 n=1 Tax=Latimeria chalumnae TaxID=7897 RepID=H3AD85_LATCH|nr:PREDICTED: coiled-coil domain-containing protein 94 [Latimeria chalumnae]|eukprot:XP_005999100.1 PREDICTED: coiled-coil domain-containing protein 94 [Latimeria chalumnae]